MDDFWWMTSGAYHALTRLDVSGVVVFLSRELKRADGSMMKPLSISILTVCGVEEIAAQRDRAVTHVLSLLDPGWPEITSFSEFAEHRRAVMHFHDIIEEIPEKSAPTKNDVAEILTFGAGLAEEQDKNIAGHLLVHCQMGISRSTAAMLMLLTQMYPDDSEDALFARLRQIRPQAWPNSRMIGFADELLDRSGRLTAALGRHYREAIKFEPKYNEWMVMLERGRELEMMQAS